MVIMQSLNVEVKTFIALSQVKPMHLHVQLRIHICTHLTTCSIRVREKKPQGLGSGEYAGYLTCPALSSLINLNCVTVVISSVVNE